MVKKMSAPRFLIIDGYNIIHKIPELKVTLAGGLENARQALALLVSRWRHDRPAIECVIVFDGDAQFSGGRDQRLSGIRCIFTRTRHGADAEIIRLARTHAGAKADITVVSDDNSIRNSCRAHGASVQPSGYILTAPPRSSRISPAAAKPSPDGKGLNGKAAAGINEELKKKFGL
jgi:predicted RNA-binding protein with PIN domain